MVGCLRKTLAYADLMRIDLCAGTTANATSMMPAASQSTMKNACFPSVEEDECALLFQFAQDLTLGLQVEGQRNTPKPLPG